ncbi:hypothetical protein DSECCO2_542020 [anaerobic digester metagenome]
MDLGFAGEEQFRDEVTDDRDRRPRGEDAGEDRVLKDSVHDCLGCLHGDPRKDREQRPCDPEKNRVEDVDGQDLAYRLKRDAAGEGREAEEQVEEKPDGAGEQVPGEEPEGVPAPADLELGCEDSGEEDAPDDAVERRGEGGDVEPESGHGSVDPESLPDEGGYVCNEDGDGSFRADACPGEEREER